MNIVDDKNFVFFLFVVSNVVSKFVHIQEKFIYIKNIRII